MDLKKKFGIKYATTKHTPGADIHNGPGMEYSFFTKAHRRSMTRVVQECYRFICEIVCPVNSEVLLNDVTGSLLEFTMLKQQTYMFQSMVQISLELPLSTIIIQALFAPIAQHFNMK